MTPHEGIDVDESAWKAGLHAHRLDNPRSRGAVHLVDENHVPTLQRDALILDPQTASSRIERHLEPEPANTDEVSFGPEPPVRENCRPPSAGLSAGIAACEPSRVPRQNTAASRVEVPSASSCAIVVTTTDADTRMLPLDGLPADCARAAAPQPNTAATANRSHITRRTTGSLRRFARVWREPSGLRLLAGWRLLVTYQRRRIPELGSGSCAVIRRSIAESCIEDHHRDPIVLAAWLANKTPDGVQGWIASPDAFCVVAESDGAIVGFAMLTMPGEISLCYLVPEAQGLGIGRAMLTTLENEAARCNLAELTPKHSIRSRVLPEVGVRRLWSCAAGPLHHRTPNAQGADAVAAERLTCSERN